MSSLVVQFTAPRTITERDLSSLFIRSDFAQSRLKYGILSENKIFFWEWPGPSETSPGGVGCPQPAPPLAPNQAFWIRPRVPAIMLGDSLRLNVNSKWNENRSDRWQKNIKCVEAEVLTVDDSWYQRQLDIGLVRRGRLSWMKRKTQWSVVCIRRV